MKITSIIAALTFSMIDLKPGQLFDHHQVTLSKDGVAGQPLSIPADEAEVTFTDLEPGVYVCEAVSIDKDGNPMTAVATSDPVTIPVTPPDQASVVNSITLTLGAPA